MLSGTVWLRWRAKVNGGVALLGCTTVSVTVPTMWISGGAILRCIAIASSALAGMATVINGWTSFLGFILCYHVALGITGYRRKRHDRLRLGVGKGGHSLDRLAQCAKPLITALEQNLHVVCDAFEG